MSEECCGTPPRRRAGWLRSPLARPIAAGALLLLAFASELWWDGAYPGGSLPVALTAQALALVLGASTFVPGALRGLLRGRLGVGLLMTIAAVGAVALGHVGETAALAFLFALAEALEDRAMDRAKHGLSALLELMPEEARVLRNGVPSRVPSAEVRVGDTLVLGAGDRIATDGIVLAGTSTLDASAVTGESIPVAVAVGDEVAAGSINGAGTLRVRATAAGQDNSLTRIVALVSQAHASKGNRARLADRISRPLVPAVLVLAFLVALIGSLLGDPATWIERALVVLVAASPCALAIAVPVTVISAIGAASRLGMVITSGAAFERLGAVRTVAFDKTGTLTRNEPRVVELRHSASTPAELLGYAAALETTSSHPLAAAIHRAAAGDALGDVPADLPTASEVIEHPGSGVEGSIAGTRVRLGHARWIDAGSLAPDVAELAGRGMTVTLLEVAGVAVAAIGIRDELRPEAAEAIDLLAQQGIGSVMLTGDNARTALALGAEAGIADVRAELLPADKAAAITELDATGPVAMIGDGINDAPALATASVGIAMGASGSAAALEAADVAFTGHDLRQLPAAFAHARRSRRIMTANIALALAVIAGLLPLALTGALGLAAVVLVHEIAEVLIIANGVRAARVRRA